MVPKGYWLKFWRRHFTQLACTPPGPVLDLESSLPQLVNDMQRRGPEGLQLVPTVGLLNLDSVRDMYARRLHSASYVEPLLHSLQVMAHPGVSSKCGRVSLWWTQPIQ